MGTPSEGKWEPLPEVLADPDGSRPRGVSPFVTATSDPAGNDRWRWIWLASRWRTQNVWSNTTTFTTDSAQTDCAWGDQHRHS